MHLLHLRGRTEPKGYVAPSLLIEVQDLGEVRVADQDDAQQGEGEQEEHRASAADGLLAGRDAAVRAMGLSNSLRGTLGLAELAEQVQRDLAPYAAIGESAQKWLAAQDAIGVRAIAADEWQREQERLSVGAEIRRLQLDSIDNMGIGRELLAEQMASIGSSMAGFVDSSFADLAQEMKRASEAHLSSLARQIADLAAIDTSAWQRAMSEIRLAGLHSFEVPEHLISPAPQRPAEPRPALPAPQPPAPQKEVHLLMQLEAALRAGTLEHSDVFRLLSPAGKPKSRPGAQRVLTDEQYFSLRTDYEQSGLTIEGFVLWLDHERGIAIGASTLKENWKRLGQTQGKQGRPL